MDESNDVSTRQWMVAMHSSLGGSDPSQDLLKLDCFELILMIAYVKCKTNTLPLVSARDFTGGAIH